ncbi:LruC domain-containing protein [Pseudoalteromonas aliena]|uniref:LruC domain-containing protein n=1 Tax=Pseudoalteromonas aliena TaxID=247523 RepID=A0A1Q2H0Y8_9GAMM|nr:LruC domain-containing protein [Pseudoalteromonas aliena]AQQ01038.1 LruC domain-containing protein [Pseudoalteromonas aliena]
MKLTQLTTACLSLIPCVVFSQSFDTCPSQAFLMQDSKAQLYGIDLVSAKPTVLSSQLTFANEVNNESVNAIGFNYKDQYLYGFSKQSPSSIVQIGDDFEMKRLDVNGLPATNFYVGDIQVTGDGSSQSASYFVYHPNYGLYSIDLNGDLDAAITAELLPNTNNWKLSIFDFAFHPTSNLLYAVESNGDLHEINIAANTSKFITQVDIGDDTGAFGAAYFDINGQFYFSNNKSGKIHKVDLKVSPVVGYTPIANVFTSGPKSSQNDGARCAIAEVKVTDSSIDFGDAPAPYNTSLEQSGARHLFDPNSTGSDLIYLGDSVDGENINTDADLINTPMDASDDGVSFVTAISAGQSSQIIVNASASSFLYAWFDWDQNGTFSEDERVVTKLAVNQGDNSILISVPSNTKSGQTWARFRVTDGTEASLITATGGVLGGEVEDYEITTFASAVYPGENDWVTLAYEDKWPYAGDYDFNDVVINYRTTQLIEGSNVVGYKIDGQLIGIGATYHNGFAVRLKETINGESRSILSSEVDEDAIVFVIDGQLQSESYLEANRNDAILIFMQDTWTHVSKQTGCSYFRTEDNCDTNVKVTFSMTIPLKAPKAKAASPGSLLDPFIFASEGFYHGDFLIDKEARSWEVHVKNQAPTEAFDSSLYSFAGSDDVSDQARGLYFLSQSGLPWAMEVGMQWLHPLEGVDITDAYENFAEFAESSGKQKSQWFNDYSISNVVLKGEQ